MLERLSFMLSGAQLGITVTGLVVGFIAEPSVSALLEPALTGIGVPDGAVSGISVRPPPRSARDRHSGQ